MIATPRIVAAQRAGGSVSTSVRMRELAAQIELLAASERTVLIFGESGTGKGRVAARIHALSRRAGRPFLAVSAADAGDVLARQFDATARTGVRTGLRDATDGGTLFLDEITALPSELQLKLLEVVDAHPAGYSGARDRAVDVRTIVATSKDLVFEVTEGRFREDLYYRLSLTPLYLPPLRACGRDELGELIMGVLAELAVQLPDAPSVLSSEAIDRLVRYPWPGNLRELRNVLERAMIVGRATGGGAIDVAHLPSELRQAAPVSDDTFEVRTLVEMERRQIARTLVAFDSNRTHAARALGISRATLIKKIRAYGLGRASR